MGDISVECVRASEFSKDAHERLLMDFKRVLSECLDKLGYRKAMINYRRNVNKYMDEIYNGKAYHFYSIRTGSKAEEPALYYESDIDRLYEVKGVVCLDSEQQSSCPIVVNLVRAGCAPGYTRLKLMSKSDADNLMLVQNYLASEEGDLYISNDFTAIDQNRHMIDINGVTITKQDKRGPSSPFGNIAIKYDFVYGLKCICPDLIEKWIARPRPYGWPDTELVKRIASLNGYVVPVANKDTRYPETEWRICYTKAELLLIESLNEFQTKLYILLKLMAKSVLKPICSEMSSYIMKNIVFWMVETNPKEFFTGWHLTDRLSDGLVFLKECLHSNTLRSYMIENRNLLQNRVTDEERSSLLKVLESLTNERENMLQRCDKVRLGLDKLNECPEEFSKAGAKRDEIEQLVLKKNIIFKEVEMPGYQVADLLPLLNGNDMYRQYDAELHRLVTPDQDEIVKLGQDPEQVFRNRLSNILS